MDTSKAATEGQCGLAEQRSTSVIKKFSHEQWLVAVDAYAADAQGVHEQVALGAATDADEAVAATAAREDGVRMSVRQGRLRLGSGWWQCHAVTSSGGKRDSSRTNPIRVSSKQGESSRPVERSGMGTAALRNRGVGSRAAWP